MEPDFFLGIHVCNLWRSGGREEEKRRGITLSLGHRSQTEAAAEKRVVVVVVGPPPAPG